MVWNKTQIVPFSSLKEFQRISIYLKYVKLKIYEKIVTFFIAILSFQNLKFRICYNKGLSIEQPLKVNFDINTVLTFTNILDFIEYLFSVFK